jgi:Neutral/alkaline non-lysosomal ceramidase, N-terminal
MLRYSATTVDVTPRVGVPLAGYVAREGRPATGVHDRLTASLLWLSAEAASSVCWVAVDALGMDVVTATRIRTAVARALTMDPDAVLVCCSHTHSGPATWCRNAFPIASTGDDVAIDRLVMDISRGAARLPATMSTVTAAWSRVADVGVGANRYDPTGPHDASTGVLALRDQDGAVVAVLADYACHPTVLSHENLEFSADYPAAARRVLRGALEATEGVETPPVVVFLQGAAGDVSTRFTRRESTFAEADRQGGLLAGALLRGVLDATAPPLGGTGPVVLRGECRVPTKRLPSAAEVRETVAAAEKSWSEVDRDSRQETPAIRIARTQYEGAQALAALREAGLPPELVLPISVVAFGDVAWTHLPVEPFTCYGERIAAGSPFPDTRIVGYTDGYFGYLADAEAHRAGRYEALCSPFDAEAGELVVAEAVALLEKARSRQ